MHMKPSPLSKSLDQVVELSKAFAPAAERALKDPELRRALTTTVIQARDLYSEARRDSAAKLGSRLARDRKFQEELGELVRNAAGTVDQARAPKKHRLRKALIWIGSVGGAAFVIVKLVKRRNAQNEDESAAPTTISPNGVAKSPSEPGSQYAAQS